MAAVETKRELIEIGLQVLVADPVMGSHQPGLEVGKNGMNDRQELFGHMRIAAFGDWQMLIAETTKSCVATPIVSDDYGAGRKNVLYEAADRIGTSIWHNC